MKLFSIVFFLSLSFGLHAQITLTQANVPAIGDTLSYARDTLPEGISVGLEGANQIWDFSQLQTDETFTLIATDAALDTESVNYPGANLVITSQSIKTFVQSSDTAVYVLGGSIPEAAAFGLGAVPFSPPQKVFQFPSTFGTSFTTSYTLDATVDGDLVFPGVDSVRAIRRSTATVLIDGYGTVRTPFNSYETLRQKTVTVNYDSLYLLVFGAWSPFGADTTENLQYEWLSAETKGNAVTARVEPTTGIIASVEFFVDVDNALSPVAAFTFEDQGQGSFAFSDQSSNTPSNWTWTFGDGNTSTEQNPVHSFAIAGDYQVCLTASNSIGSNQSCQTVTVDILNSSKDPFLPIPGSVFPNPAKQYIMIKPEGISHSSFDLQLYNSVGQKVLNRQFEGQLRLDVQDLPIGIYTYQLNTSDQKRKRTGKLQIIR